MALLLEPSRRMMLNNITNRQPHLNDQVSSEVHKNEAVTERLDDLPPLSEKEMKEHIQLCLKMYTEKKININNTWKLKIIDYLKYFLDSQGLDIHSLQMVANSLDTCAKVYHFKVEDLYNITRQLLHTYQTITPTKITTNAYARKQKETKKLHKVNVAQDLTSFLNDILKIKSTFFQIPTNPDSSFIDNLFTNKLIMDHKRWRFMHLNQEKAWPSFLTTENLVKKYPFKWPLVSNFEICAPLRNFKIGEEDVEDGNWFCTENKLPMEEVDELVCDDYGIPIPNLDESSNLFITGECVKQLKNDNSFTKNGVAQIIKNVTNFMPYECDTRPDEYCFSRLDFKNKVITHIWAGPSHWKLKYIRQMDTMSSNIVKRKRKKQINFEEPLIDFELDDAPFEKLNMCSPKKRKIDLPSYKCTFPRITYKHRNNGFLMLKPFYIGSDKCEKAICDKKSTLNHNNSEYQNEIMNNSLDNINVSCQDAGEDALKPFPNETWMPSSQQDEKNILYPLRAKRINMRLLKTAIWKTVSDAPSYEDVDEINTTKKFSEIYNEIPEFLPRLMKEELSLALVFVGMLHICNEKNIDLKQNEELGDFTLEKAAPF